MYNTDTFRLTFFCTVLYDTVKLVSCCGIVVVDNSIGSSGGDISIGSGGGSRGGGIVNCCGDEVGGFGTVFFTVLHNTDTFRLTFICTVLCNTVEFVSWLGGG